MSARIKHVILQGADPDDPDRYPTRSEALFAVLCAMVRADCDELTIAAVCLDTSNAVSGHLYDQQGESPGEYLDRQIVKARQKVFEPKLVELNERHAVIRDAGKTVVMNEEWDKVLKRRFLTHSTFDDHRNFYDNQLVAVGQDGQGQGCKGTLHRWASKGGRTPA